MNELVKWLSANQAWLFSGIGAAILGGIAKLIWARMRRRPGATLSRIHVQQTAGDGAVQVGGDLLITSGIGDSQNDTVQGKACLWKWGEGMVKGEWNWYHLDHALDHFRKAIKSDARNDEPLTEIAYIYHLVGDRAKALDSLGQADRLRRERGAGQSRRHLQIKNVIENDTYLTVPARVERREPPGWFRDRWR